MKLPIEYERHLQIPSEQVVCLPEDTKLEPSSIETGVLFVLAKWAGASQLSFRALNDVFKASPHVRSIRLHVASSDNDNTQAFMQRAGDSPGGYGEAYWIRDGVVQAKVRTCGPENESALKEYTDALFE